MTVAGPHEERPDGQVPVGEVLRAARDAFASLFGREPESVSGVEKVDGGWRLIAEVTELERIPPSTSMMASYEISLNERGELKGYRRQRSYYRSQAGEA